MQPLAIQQEATPDATPAELERWRASLKTDGKFKLQIMSDLHLEFLGGGTHNIEPKAPYLALLGDIGVLTDEGMPHYRKFLLEQANQFKKVFVLLGNHEYYGSTVARTLQRVKEICDSHPNLVMMQQGSVKVNGVRILGTTLWSKVPPESVRFVASSLNDYRRITTDNGSNNNGTRNISVTDTNSWFQTEVEWLAAEIEKANVLGETVVVLTHHAPISDSCDPQHYSSPINSAFCTPLEFLLGAPVALWAYGHTHWVSDVIRNGTRVMTNACGYPATHEVKNFHWNPELVVEI